MKTGITVILALLAAHSLCLASEGGTSTEGGGQTVDVDGRPELRDLVNNAVCRWVKGKAFEEKLSYYPRALAGIAKTHWYLADAIQRYGRNVKICLTNSELKVIHADDLA